MTFSQPKASRYNPDHYTEHIDRIPGNLHLTMPAPQCPPCTHGNFHHFEGNKRRCTVCGWERPA